MKKPTILTLAIVLLLSACMPTAPQATQQPTVESTVEMENSMATEEMQEEPAAEAEAPQLIEGEDPPRGAENEFGTDFSIHSVSYNEFQSGGPRKDGIPSLDSPSFVRIDQAIQWLQDSEPVVVVEVDGIAKAYPIQILTWHEIVNDEVNGLPVTVSFCPLCNSALAFEREINGVIYDFGTSGRLRNNNLVMYDRQTESWWQQTTGEALVGELTGQTLTRFPAAMTSFLSFQERYPEGQVLSKNTGFSRDYGQNPYVGYDDPLSSPFLFDGERSSVLNAMERILAVEINDSATAYPFTVLQEVQVINDTIDALPIVVFWQTGTNSALDDLIISAGEDVGAAAAYESTLDGQRLTFAVKDDLIFDMETGSIWDIHGYATDGVLVDQRLTPVISSNHFWFSWYIFRSDTDVYLLEETTSSIESAEGVNNVSIKYDFPIDVYQGFENNTSLPFIDVFQDGKPVVVNFWAPLCPACVIEMDDLEQTYQDNKNSVNFVAVDIGPFVGLGNKQDALALIAEKQLTFPAGSTPDVEVIRQYTVLGTPTTVFFNSDGSIGETWTGVLTYEQFNNFIEQLY